MIIVEESNLPVCCGQKTVYKHGWECNYAECTVCHAMYDQCNVCGEYSDDPCEDGICNMCAAHDLVSMGFVYDLNYTHMHGHHWRYTGAE